MKMTPQETAIEKLGHNLVTVADALKKTGRRTSRNQLSNPIARVVADHAFDELDR